MHAVARYGPIAGLVLMLLASSGVVRAATAVVGVPDADAPGESVPQLSIRASPVAGNSVRLSTEPRGDPRIRVAKLIDGQEVQ